MAHCSALSCLAPMPRNPEQESGRLSARLVEGNRLVSEARYSHRTAVGARRRTARPSPRTRKARQRLRRTKRVDRVVGKPPATKAVAASTNQTERSETSSPPRFGTRDQDVRGDILAVAVVGRAHDRVRLGCREGWRISAGMAATDWRRSGPTHLGPARLCGADVFGRRHTSDL